MPLPAIQVENLSKRYFLRHQATPHDGLRHRLESTILHPIRSWKNRALQKKTSREEFWPLKDLTFNIQPGEIVGIIGRNGAGKSTLLKILSRITEPTSGHIEIEGRIASLLEVGTGFHPELSGRENIFLNGAILGMSRAEIKSKFAEIVDFAEIEKFLDTPVKRYSSGMYVRLAFAVAAHLDSDILIVDEVLAVGDAQFQKKCLGKMDDISKNGGRTVLLVSHQMAAISNLCPKSIVLHQGRFAFFGPTSDAISHYLGLAETTSPNLPLSSFRPHWASPCITSARLLSLDSTPQDHFPLGAGLTIELAYQSPPATPIRQPILGVVIKHHSFGTVASVNMRMTGFHPSPSSTSGTITCSLPELPLLQGSYSIDLWLGDGPIDLDLLSDYLHFSIEEADVYGSGQLPFANHGAIFLQPKWSFSALP